MRRAHAQPARAARKRTTRPAARSARAQPARVYREAAYQTRRLTPRVRRLLRARRDQDEVGREAQEQPQQDPPSYDRLRCERAPDVQQLHHDVEDRAGGEREEQDHHALVDPRLTDNGADERRPAADEPEQREEAPARRLAVTGQRRADAEPLRRVVEAEADDQDERQRE